MIHKLKPTADDLVRLRKNDQARKARKSRLVARRKRSRRYDLLRLSLTEVRSLTHPARSRHARIAGLAKLANGCNRRRVEGYGQLAHSLHPKRHLRKLHN
jgi:hypothetical protein